MASHQFLNISYRIQIQIHMPNITWYSTYTVCGYLCPVRNHLVCPTNTLAHWIHCIRCVHVCLLFAGNRQPRRQRHRKKLFAAQTPTSITLRPNIYNAQQIAVPLLSFVKLFKAFTHTSSLLCSLCFFFWS